MHPSNKKTHLTDRRNNRTAVRIQSAVSLALLVAAVFIIGLGLNFTPVRVAQAAQIQNGKRPTPVEDDAKSEPAPKLSPPVQSGDKATPTGSKEKNALSVTVTPAGSPTPTDNDYTRIKNAIQTAMNGDTITLSGTFNWTEANAAASWALGNDGMAGTLDDFSILVPGNLNNVTFTATSLGAATIQGPGDLANVDLEGVLFFDSLSGSKNQGWTISNVRFLDFDLTVGMFFDTAGAVDAFNNTKIMNNYIRVAKDLDSSVAPSDVAQNIGIHFSFGTNQMITGNMIDLDGSAVRTNDAAEVGMQSNTSGGNVYEGLQITNNILHVLNAQSAGPEVIIGIWENAHAHLSNITVSGNQFTNLAGGNSPTTNLQRAFRVTSHSSLLTTVKYQNNTAQGANIGFQWLAGSNFAGNQPVQLISNAITGNATGVLIQSNGSATLSFNRIASNTVGLNNSTMNAINAENNWWGCNFGPGLGGAGCMGTANGVTNPTGGSVDSNPWLVLKLTAAPGSITVGGTSTLTADLTFNSDNVDTHLSGTIPDGTPVTFAGVNGTVSPMNTTTTAGKATSTYTGTTVGPGSASATVDMQTVQVPIIVNPAPCSITCPPNKTQSNDPNQCGAVVTYNAPTTTGTCGTVTCSPSSGSFFPVGTTTVTCTTMAGPSCNFTVSVTDTQPPSITCPANTTAVTPNPGNPGGVVTFPPPTASDNCPGVTTVCNPPSGSTFPLGCTTVTCTATDTSNNTATCSFQVCVFDICLQDDSNPANRILINSATGDYRFCCNGTTFTGRGKIAIQGSTYSLEHNTIDRRVRASVTSSSHVGNASLQSPPGRLRCNITDSDTRNNTTCGTCQ